MASAALPQQTRRVTTFVPRAETDILWPSLQEPPARPADIGPVFDLQHADEPLASWTEGASARRYPEKEDAHAPSPVPQEDMGQTQAGYLPPILARHERLRLTMLWYYTRGLERDKELQSRLQEKVRLVQELVGWEFVITGLLDNDVYTRIATAGVPLAILPRREATCAHTINQSSIFNLPDMLKDWRFRNSPHVEYGGLRSYVGSPLRLETEFGETIALGSLCIASNSVGRPLSPTKQAALRTFSDMISAEIIHAARLRRQEDRHHMSQMMLKIQNRIDKDDAEELIVNVLKESYPGAIVNVQASERGFIQLQGREAISFFDVVASIWEDSEYLDSLISTMNHQPLSSEQTVRAIVGRCTSYSIPTFVVVASSDVRHVFDDVDAWFVDRCAVALSNVQQDRDLKKALKAKETFLRGVTHQLRTPIHGVLGSVELLAEELRSRKLLEDIKKQENDAPAGEFNAAPFIQTIRTSGRELMLTVDSMLKLNRWNDVTCKPMVATVHDLKDLETSIMSDITQTIRDEQLSNISVFFNTWLPEECARFFIDMTILKDCLHHLITNAIQNSSTGLVKICTSADRNRQDLQIDVFDMGCGIQSNDHQRIFDAYEKIDPHSKGVGLGLTLASKLAALMNGSVNLVSSVPGHGSHFQLRFHKVGFQPMQADPHSPPLECSVLPKRYHRPSVKRHSPVVESLCDYLSVRGFEESGPAEASIVVCDSTHDVAQLEAMLNRGSRYIAAIYPVPPGADTDQMSSVAQKHNFIALDSPFLSMALDKAMLTVADQYTQWVHLGINGVNGNVTLSDVQSSLGKLELKDGLSATVKLESVTSSLKLEITLPTDVVTAHSITPSDHPGSTPPIALLVDDNAINLRILQMYCKKRKIPYATAIDGHLATRAFQEPTLPPPHTQRQFNLVLMDLQMPVRDGIEATADIRQYEKDQGLKPSIILMITGQDSTSDRIRAEEAGADAYLVKPVAMTALDAAISQFFPASFE